MTWRRIESAAMGVVGLGVLGMSLRVASMAPGEAYCQAGIYSAIFFSDFGCWDGDVWVKRGLGCDSAL